MIATDEKNFLYGARGVVLTFEPSIRGILNRETPRIALADVDPAGNDSRYVVAMVDDLVKKVVQAL